MARVDSWTARWASERIAHNKITAVRPIGPNWIEIDLQERKSPVKVATISVKSVGADDLHEVYTSPGIEFILNIPKDSVFRQDALEMSEHLAFGLGSVGDLYVAANEDEFRHYLPKEFRFILRGLKQHTAVSSIVRLNNRLLKVSRFGLKDVRVLALNDYDLTADAVRSGMEQFGQAEIILTSNPNCRPSKEAAMAANSCGAKVLAWGGLLGELNH